MVSTSRILSTLTIFLLAITTSFCFTTKQQRQQQKHSSKISNTTTNAMASSSSSSSNNPSNKFQKIQPSIGKIEQLKSKEAALSRLLAAVRREKIAALRSRPLTIGIIGFGRFGQFIAKTFAEHGTVVATSRSDYTELARGMGVEYIPLSNPDEFFSRNLDVVVLATSIVSFEGTVRGLLPSLARSIEESETRRGPLIVDVLSVKDYPRQILLDLLPKECDILCTHPMFGPDSGKNGWHDLNFVYERTRIDAVILDQVKESKKNVLHPSVDKNEDVESFVEEGSGKIHSVHEHSEAHIEGMDRIERFLSIWEEEGCRMVSLSCRDHDMYAANSQFITHLMGRILGAQGLEPTPIDTKGFDSVLRVIDSTTADSFDLFYGLYKYNQNSMDTIMKLRDSMDDVVEQLSMMELNDK
eukprot:scaffold1768_cov275-Chaetoceros_neogracile.AAC.6